MVRVLSHEVPFQVAIWMATVESGCRCVHDSITRPSASRARCGVLLPEGAGAVISTTSPSAPPVPAEGVASPHAARENAARAPATRFNKTEGWSIH